LETIIDFYFLLKLKFHFMIYEKRRFIANI